MQLDTRLTPQKLFARSREVGINLNYWYPAEWADQLKPGQLKKIVLWQKAILIFRGQDGRVRAMDNQCLHKGVELHRGEVKNNQIVCPYHGWEFDGHGQCTAIPYFADAPILEQKRINTYPVIEKYNLIWIFPGDPDLATECSPPEVPEAEDPDWLIVEIPAHFKVHFSIVNENPLDVFHSYLHRDLPNWYAPVLKQLHRDEDSVQAAYEVRFKNGWLSRFLGLTDSKEPEIIRTIDVGYHYPHCRNTMAGKSNYYFMRCPVGPNETRSFGLMCLKLRLPDRLWKLVRKPLSRILWRFMVKPFLDQDIDVMESEQRVYQRNPQRKYMEINPVIAAAQRLTVNKYDLWAESAGSSRAVDSARASEPTGSQVASKQDVAG